MVVGPLPFHASGSSSQHQNSQGNGPYYLFTPSIRSRSGIRAKLSNSPLVSRWVNRLVRTSSMLAPGPNPDLIRNFTIMLFRSLPFRRPPYTDSKPLMWKYQRLSMRTIRSAPAIPHFMDSPDGPASSLLVAHGPYPRTMRAFEQLHQLFLCAFLGTII